MSLRVDRDRFLLLVSTLAAAGCSQRIQESMGISLEPASSATSATPQAPASAPATPAPPVTTASATKTVSTSSAKSAAAAPANTQAPAHADDTPTVDCGSQNDDGVVDCSALKAAKLSGPSCEGLSGNCDLLAGGKTYRHRAARAAVACMNRAGARACDIGVRRRCYEEGVRASCPEAQFASVCEAKMQQCRAAGHPVTYTKEECMKAASALTGGDRTWALSAMGPSSEGSCRLMFTVF